jgi:hypothetical protein
MPNKNKFNNTISKLVIPKSNITKRAQWLSVDGELILSERNAGALRDYLRDVAGSQIEKKLIVKDTRLGKQICYWIYKCKYCPKKYRLDFETIEIRPENNKPGVVVSIKADNEPCGCGCKLELK